MVQRYFDFREAGGNQQFGRPRPIDAEDARLGADVKQLGVVVEEDVAHEIAGQRVGVAVAGQHVRAVAGGVEEDAIDDAADVGR